MRDGDINHDGMLDFKEFSEYLQAHEKRLSFMFHNLDRNKDGEHMLNNYRWNIHASTVVQLFLLMYTLQDIVSAKYPLYQHTNFGERKYKLCFSHNSWDDLKSKSR